MRAVSSTASRGSVTRGERLHECTRRGRAPERSSRAGEGSRTRSPATRAQGAPGVRSRHARLDGRDPHRYVRSRGSREAVGARVDCGWVREPAHCCRSLGVLPARVVPAGFEGDLNCRLSRGSYPSCDRLCDPRLASFARRCARARVRCNSARSRRTVGTRSALPVPLTYDASTAASSRLSPTKPRASRRPAAVSPASSAPQHRQFGVFVTTSYVVRRTYSSRLGPPLRTPFGRAISPFAAPIRRKPTRGGVASLPPPRSGVSSGRCP